MRAAVLVMAKAPVPGQVKTRLGAHVGNDVAAELAAACILDTLDVCEAVFPEVGGRHVALAGDLAGAVHETELRERLGMWMVHPQHGDGFAERLVHAHATVARDTGAPVVQIGMDTPHVTESDLASVVDLVGDGNDAVLGPADDGGWWVLALTDPRFAESLRTVAMSTEKTYADTLRGLEGAGAHVVGTRTLRDVDEPQDADLAAASAPGTRFARLWSQVCDGVAR